MFHVVKVLERAEAAAHVATLDNMLFGVGADSAGAYAKLVKNNMQVLKSNPQYEELNNTIQDKIMGNKLFHALAMPRYVTDLIFNQYYDGMEYGYHVDNPIIQHIRGDVSFTLFLTDGYEGGELILDLPTGTKIELKGEAGEMVFYSTRYQHRVKPVTKGSRLAAVGWVQSTVRDEAQRYILNDIDVARASIFAKEQQSPAFEKLTVAYTNLIRMWADG